MPTLPAPFIHLFGVLRPRLLRPDVRVASIVQVDFAGLKKAGFNAVVVDKDNCVTLPHSDSIFPAYAPAWNSLLATFPGRVLVVSNSAGSAKDRGGIGAESLSMSLRAPVLAHKHPKPACASEILDFFTGKAVPHTSRSTVLARLKAVEQSEDSAEHDLLMKWRDEVENGPLCGPLRDAPPTLEEKMAAATRAKPPPKVAPVQETEPTPTPSPQLPSSPLRILVVGDRLFTDTLQARQLDERLASSPYPSTLMIQTTDLPQPNDVRILRRFEDWLAGPSLAHGGKAGGIDWSRYVTTPPVPAPEPRWIDVQLARINPVKALDDGGPPITWDPRTWRPRPVAAAVLSGLGTATGYISAKLARAIKIGSAWGWRNGRAWVTAKWAEMKEHRAARAQDRERAAIAREAEQDKVLHAEPVVAKEKV